MKRERRYTTGELRTSETTAALPMISGYANKTLLLSQDLGGFRERFAPGAFSECIERGDEMVCLFNHNSDLILGRRSAGTMRVGDDAVGLWYECDPPDTTPARDLVVSLRRRDITGSSFQFYVEKEDQTWAEDAKTGELIRTIHRAICVETSPVTFPAYLDSTASVRSLFPDGFPDIPAKYAKRSHAAPAAVPVYVATVVSQDKRTGAFAYEVNGVRRSNALSLGLGSIPLEDLRCFAAETALRGMLKKTATRFVFDDPTGSENGLVSTLKLHARQRLAEYELENEDARR